MLIPADTLQAVAHAATVAREQTPAPASRGTVQSQLVAGVSGVVGGKLCFLSCPLGTEVFWTGKRAYNEREQVADDEDSDRVVLKRRREATKAPGYGSLAPSSLSATRAPGFRLPPTPLSPLNGAPSPLPTRPLPLHGAHLRFRMTLPISSSRQPLLQEIQRLPRGCKVRALSSECTALN